MPATLKNPRLPKRTRIRRKPSLDFSLTGLIYTSMMLFMGLAAINSQANLLFGVFGLMIGVLLVSGVISRLVLKKVEARRLLPEFLVVGEPASLNYELENRKRFWPSLSVTIGELGPDSFTRQPQAYLLHAAAGTTATIPMLVVPKRRGLHRFEHFQLSTSFPFGFIKRAADRRHVDTLVIYPPLAELDRRLIAMCLSAEQGSAQMKPRRGGADEFYGVKEYRQGENPRHIYWRRSARTGTIVSKEMSHVAPPRILILVDTHLMDRSAESHAAVERSIAMAASLISRTIDEGLAVGLFVWSGDWSLIAPTKGKRHSHELLAFLARLPRNTTHDRRELIDNSQKVLHSGTTPLLFTPHALEQSLAERARGNWIVIPSDSGPFAQWFHFKPDINFLEVTPADQLS